MAPGTVVGALLFTSIHVTLLGALFALTPRPLYMQHEGMPAQGLFDLHLGGAVMLVVGGASYTLAALGLLAALVSDWRRTHTATHP